MYLVSITPKFANTKAIIDFYIYFLFVVNFSNLVIFTMTDIHKIARDLEFYETAEWAAREILNHEILTAFVIDPCAGSGILGDAARKYDCNVIESDVYPWSDCYRLHDFLNDLPLYSPAVYRDATIFMNPPFSKSAEFVQRCFDLNVRKIICFQRLAWTESAARRKFWDENPPNRKYACGDRATSWLGTIPHEQRNVPRDKGGAGAAGPTAYGWYVWERGHPPGTLETRIYKS